MSNEEPYLRKIGAGTRGPASKVNLDVSGTVGPDYLGQETVDVNGHRCDRPGVRYRAPETHPTVTYQREDGEERTEPSYEVARMDTGEELPVLLESRMSADPCEGVQGSYTEIVEGECVRCGYDRLVVSVHTMMGEAREQCNACNAIQEPRAEHGYRMPKTQAERANEIREAGDKIGSTRYEDVYYKDGWRYVDLVRGNDDTRRMFPNEVEELYWVLIDEGVIDLSKNLEDLHWGKRLLIAFDILPEEWTIEKKEETSEEEE